jgi:hypothetical protein
MPIWNAFTSALNDLAAILGPIGSALFVVSVVALLLGFVLVSLYMVLHFGHEGAHMFLPFLHEAFTALRSESTKTDPAIRLEMRFQTFLGAIIILCLLASLLHALIPWGRDRSEQIFLGALITSTVLFVCLGCVSLNLSLRLR